MIWTRDESKERFPDSISPLGWSVLQSALSANLNSIKSEFHLKKLDKNSVTRWIDGYLYSSQDFFKRIPFHHFSISAWILLGLRLLAYGVQTVFETNRNLKFKTRWIHRIYQKEILPKVQAVIDQWQTSLPDHLKNFDDNALAALTWQPTDENFNELLKKIEIDGCNYNRLDFAIYFYKNLLKSIIERQAALESQPISISKLSSQSPFQIGQHINHIVSEGILYHDPSDATSSILKGLGHLSLSWDIAQPTFSEQPKLIDTIISEKKKNKKTDTMPTPAADDDSDPLTRQFIQLVSCDEQHRFYASYQFPTVRSLLYKIAHIWLKKSLLSNKEDLFYLTLEEIVRFHSDLVMEKMPTKEEIQNIILTRKSYIKSSAKDNLSEDTLKEREDIFYTSEDDLYLESEPKRSDWSGAIASAGLAQGKAFWVTDYSSLSNCPQDSIVLCKTPSPNFHAAFVKAKAILSESGGLLSHGAIIARELQIPCLLQVNYLKTIKNGDLIEVNANKGFIKRL